MANAEGFCIFLCLKDLVELHVFWTMMPGSRLVVERIEAV